MYPKPHRTHSAHPRRTATACLLAAMALAPSGHAATLYWDNNTTTSGFGTATGTWSSAGGNLWNQDVLGGSASGGFLSSYTTTTTDVLNFGTASAGLAAGTIAVSGTVSSGNITFGSGSGSILLSGGTITLAAATTITQNSANAATISSNLSGAATGITKAGTGTLILSGTNSYSGATTVNAGVLRLNSAITSGNVVLAGGMLGLGNANITFTGVGTGANQVRFSGDGGFAAYGANRTVVIGTASTSINWTATNFIGTGNELLLSSTDSDATIIFNQAISFSGGTRTINVANGSAAVDAVMGQTIAGGTSGTSNGFTKTGTGTLALTATNTYWGPTTVSQGTLMLGNGTGNTGRISDNSATITVSTGATLAVNRTGTTTQVTDLSGVIIDGAGGFSQVGSGTTSLTLANTFSGGATVTNGTLQVGVASVGSVGSITSSAVGTGTLALNGGTLSSDSTTARTILNSVTIGGNVTLGNATNTGQLTFSAATNLGGATRQLTTNSNVVVSGVISNGGITKTGDAALNLEGANTYSGATTLSAGALRIAFTSPVGSVGNITSSTLGTGALILNGGTFSSNFTSARTILNPVTVGGNVTLGNATNNGQLNFSDTVDLNGATRQLTLDSNVVFNGAVTNGGLTKLGTGRLTLSNVDNSLSGGTSITDGTLLVNGSLTSASNAVSVGSSGTLGGTGTIAGATTVSGRLAPGSSGIGKINLAALTFNSGSTFVWEMNFDGTARGVNYDAVDTTGALTGSGAAFNIVLPGTESFGASYWQTSRTWSDIFGAKTIQGIFNSFAYSNSTGTITGPDPLTQGTFTFDGTDLVWSAIPEPSAFAAFAGLGALGVAGLRRRRRA